MSTIKDIAKILAQKHGISNAEAEQFLQQMVETINEGLLTDRLVKIKSFGTFKLQNVKERISVNVNTGEKVTIAGHDKINFLPDALMKDVVNKPFAQFETVILGNEAAADETVEEIGATEEIIQPEVPVSEKLAITEDPISVEDSNIEKEENSISTQVSSFKEEFEPNQHEKEAQNEVSEDIDCPVIRKSCKTYFIYMAIMINVLVAVAAFAAGYYAANANIFESLESVSSTAKTKETQTTSARPTTKSAKTANHTKKVNKSASKAKEETKNQPLQHTADTSVFKEDYTSDPRVRTGAYTITGIAKTITIKNGQTLKSISKAYLGPDMECYVEAVNDGTKSVEEGQEIKIPALKLKHKKK